MKTEKKMDGKSSIKRENFSLHKALKHTYFEHDHFIKNEVCMPFYSKETSWIIINAPNKNNIYSFNRSNNRLYIYCNFIAINS